MDLLSNDGASIEEDRISNLPDDIIHHILSFLDMRYVIRTCILSRRWKNTWTSMSNFKLDSRKFKRQRDFAKFVEDILTHRNDCMEVSEVELRFDRQTDHECVQNIMNYVNLHNARKLTMKCISRKNFPYLFSSGTLKNFILEEDPRRYTKIHKNYLPELAWDFPALETLRLRKVRLDDPVNKSFNLLSKCVNLKDLTLHRVYMHGRRIFNVCAPQLLNLTITNSVTFPEVFNVVAPRLKSLTASLIAHPYRLENGGPLFLPLISTYGGFNSLEKVNLSFGLSKKKKRRHGSQLLRLFRIICKAQFLNLDVDIIENLSNSCLDRLSCEPCPFNNLKSLKIIAKSLEQNKRIATLPVQIKNYFLQNSPSVTCHSITRYTSDCLN